MKFYKMRYFKIILVFFMLASCDVSTISEADAKNLAKLKVHISIHDENSLDELKVQLSDGKKKIINDKIAILLNGKPLELFVKQDLYYTKTSFYRDTSLIRRESYYFEIILPDSTKHPIAYIKPFKKSERSKFYIPKEKSSNENISLTWENAHATTALQIWKSVHKKDVTKNSAGRLAETSIRDTLHSKSGKYVIPKSFYEDPLTVTDYLIIRLNQMDKGLINPELIENSSITYDYTIEEIIHIDK
jgi:hypothetical protein